MGAPFGSAITDILHLEKPEPEKDIFLPRGNGKMSSLDFGARCEMTELFRNYRWKMPLPAKSMAIAIQIGIGAFLHLKTCSNYSLPKISSVAF